MKKTNNNKYAVLPAIRAERGYKMKKYQVVEIDTSRGYNGDEFIICETDDLNTALREAEHNWDAMTYRDQKITKIEIRTDFQFDSAEDEEDELYSGYNTVTWQIEF